MQCPSWGLSPSPVLRFSHAICRTGTVHFRRPACPQPMPAFVTGLPGVTSSGFLGAGCLGHFPVPVGPMGAAAVWLRCGAGMPGRFWGEVCLMSQSTASK